MDEKIMFIPKTEEYIHDGLVTYITVFVLGFFEVSLRMIRSELAGITRVGLTALQKTNPDLAKKYINIMTIGKFGWIWFTTDDFIHAEISYRNIVKKLKFGEEVEFIDMGGQCKPVRISWQGIKFQW